jgi:60 kDa SS-A/Ro ribonucleoprotein
MLHVVKETKEQKSSRERGKRTMSRFNNSLLSPTRVARTPNTINRAGGDAWAQTPEAALVGLATTSTLANQFYRSADETVLEAIALVGQVDPYFAAQTAVYARTTENLRSISHLMAAEIAHTVKGETWTKNFYNAVVARPDDVTEILSAYIAMYGKPIPNSLKKGLGLALGKFDAYQLAKYRGEKNGLSLVDAVNLVHARPTGKNAEALSQLVNGTLRSAGTFEATLSAAGSDAGAKTAAWGELITTGKIGYMALLKNLRNVAEQAPELVPAALALLTDRKRVLNSKVLPFRFITAASQLQSYPKILQGISDAVDISLENLPDLGESAYIVVDGSASMQQAVAGNDQMTCKYVGALFAAALFKRSGATVAVFGDDCGIVTGLNPADSTLSLADRINQATFGSSTNFQSIFERAEKKYDTVVIFSDMQAWVQSAVTRYGGYGYSNPAPALAEYQRRTKATPKVFAFDLTGYGSTQFPEKGVYQMSGFSDKSVAMIGKFREDPAALISEVKKISF